MNETIKAYLPSDLAKRAREKAVEKNLSLSSYIQSLVRADTAEKDAPATAAKETTETGSNESSIRITIAGKDARLLKEKAFELGISPTAWVRNAINTKTFHVINFSMNDLDEFLAAYNRNVEHIQGVASVCLDTKNVFPQDLEFILYYMKEITALFKKHFSAAYKTRKEVFYDLVKKYEGRNLK